MGRWTVRDEVREATMDIWGRRTGTRTFVVWDTPIDEGTARRLSQQVSGDSDSLFFDNGSFGTGAGLPMPGIGDAWSSEVELSKYAQMYLDHYDVTIQGQEIIATAHYSTDSKFSGMEIGWSTVLTDIPYATRLTTGVSSAQAGGPNGLVRTWQYQNYRIPVCMPRLQITGQVNMADMGEVNDRIRASVNMCYWLKLLRPSPNLTEAQAGSANLWKFEGANATQTGPDFCDVRYSFISDPGQVSITWPTSFAATDPDSNFTVPPQEIGFAERLWVRAPFHELKIIPPTYINGEQPTPQNPKRPSFVQIPTIKGIGSNNSETNAQVLLPGVGMFPLTVRRRRDF